MPTSNTEELGRFLKCTVIGRGVFGPCACWEGNLGYAPGESLPSTPLKDGEQPKNKAKPKRSNKRHRQGNGGGTMPKIWAI